MSTRSLCENCLEVREDVRPLEIGPDKGHQRDPYREQLQLCGECAAPLLDHSLPAFHARFKSERETTIRRTS